MINPVRELRAFVAAALVQPVLRDHTEPAAVVRRRRIVLPVPVLTPRLASHWVGLVTPVPAGVAKPLVGSLVHEVVRREHDLEEYVPPPARGLIGFDEAVRRAMAGTRPDHA